MTQQDSRPPKGITRRRFLGAAGAAGLILVSGSPVWSAPKRGSAPGRPRITHGVQSGDVSVRSGVVWARADRPARMIVEVSPTESFRRVRRYRGPVATP
ncbi:MAG: PhoD-like phosphatase N-terminal domain-containing protein, partial [Actinomycetota bacterium]